MNSPHFYLRSESLGPEGEAGGRWRFVLLAEDGGERFEAADDEPLAQGERLELLAAVRGLEALNQPSRVTLSTGSRFVYQGVIQGLEQWRANDWQWERFGELAPIKHRDLWQRMAHALAIHQVECRLRGRHTPRPLARDEQESHVEQAQPQPQAASKSRRRWRVDGPHTNFGSRGNGESPAPRKSRKLRTVANEQSDAPPAESTSLLTTTWESLAEAWHHWWRPTRVELAS